MSVTFTFELPEERDEFDLMFEDVLDTIETEGLGSKYNKKTDKLIKDLDKKMEDWREIVEMFDTEMKARLFTLKKAKNPTIRPKAITAFIHYKDRDYVDVGQETTDLAEKTAEAVKGTEQNVTDLISGKASPGDLGGKKGLAITPPLKRIEQLSLEMNPGQGIAYDWAKLAKYGITPEVLKTSLEIGIECSSQLERLFNVLDKMIRQTSEKLTNSAADENADKKALALALTGLKLSVKTTHKLTKEVYLFYNSSTINLCDEIDGLED